MAVDTNLTSISTYGWFTGEEAGEVVLDTLTPISTFGWWLDIIILGQPDVIDFILDFDRTLTFGLER
jgi:hypothetical protein